MDPSAKICLLYDSLKEEPKEVNIRIGNNWFTQNEQIYLTPRYEGEESIGDEILEIENNKEEGIARKIGKGIFSKRAGIKMANIDAVVNITNEIFTYDNKQSNNIFKVCDINGKATEYLKYRFPLAKVYTIDNINEKWEELIDYIDKNEPEGVDLVSSSSFSMKDYNKYNESNRRRLLVNSLIGIRCCKRGGNFIMRIFNIMNDTSVQILYILSQCFNEITIFKPITSSNNEKFIICKNRREEIDDYLNLLDNGIKLNLNRLFVENPNQDFIEWITQINNELEIAESIVPYYEYDIHKFLIIWNLPDTPSRFKKTSDYSQLLPGDTAILIR